MVQLIKQLFKCIILYNSSFSNEFALSFKLHYYRSIFLLCRVGFFKMILVVYYQSSQDNVYHIKQLLSLIITSQFFLTYYSTVIGLLSFIFILIIDSIAQEDVNTCIRHDVQNYIFSQQIPIVFCKVLLVGFLVCFFVVSFYILCIYLSCSF